MVTGMRAGPIIRVTVGNGITTAIVTVGITRTEGLGITSIGEPTRLIVTPKVGHHCPAFFMSARRAKRQRVGRPPASAKGKIMQVVVPSASTVPLASTSRPSAVAIRRPREVIRPSARTGPVASVTALT